MEIWTPPLTEAEYGGRWQACADRAAFGGAFTRAFTGGRRYTQLEAAVLNENEHRLLWEASAALAGILTRVTEWVQRSPALLPVLGIRPELEPWVTRAPGSGPFAAHARLDWVQDTAGRWWCLECNADTPGGLPEATVWQELALQAGEGLQNPNAGLLERLGSVLREWLPGRAGFLTSPGHVEDWENTLAAAGARGGDWVPLTAHAAAGAEIDSLYKFYPGDWLVRHPALLARLSAGLPCANPGRALAAQSKAVLALLWHLADERQFLTASEQDWVRAFIPRTSLLPLDGAWVAKPYWEREGAGIYAGEGQGAGAPGYVYQSRVDILSLPVRVWPLEGVCTVAARPVVGVYLAAGEPAGYLTRLGAAITDRGAHMVPTLLRTGRQRLSKVDQCAPQTPEPR